MLVELRVSEGEHGKRRTVRWDGRDAATAIRNYVRSHPGHVVWAWRRWKEINEVVAGMGRILEPGDRGW